MGPAALRPYPFFPSFFSGHLTQFCSSYQGLLYLSWFPVINQSALPSGLGRRCVKTFQVPYTPSNSSRNDVVRVPGLSATN